jgi:hypothetical protein
MRSSVRLRRNVAGVPDKSRAIVALAASPTRPLGMPDSPLALARQAGPCWLFLTAFFEGQVRLYAAPRSAAQEGELMTPNEAGTIAKEAYIYGYPLVDNYRINYSYFVDAKSPEFKAPWNVIDSAARVFRPDDKAIQTPNSDTPYSMLGMDLRAEPLVLTTPPIEKGRYFSVQLIDAYTHNFDYIGSRTTGNGGGHYMVAGPNWKGETPRGAAQVFRSETELAFAFYRTQLFSPPDLERVKTLQAGYRVQPLSTFLGASPPPSA